MYTRIQLHMCVYLSAGRIVPSFLGVFRGWQASDCSSPTDEDARQTAAGIMEACQGVIATQGKGGALPCGAAGPRCHSTCRLRHRRSCKLTRSRRSIRRPLFVWSYCYSPQPCCDAP